MNADDAWLIPKTKTKINYVEMQARYSRLISGACLLMPPKFLPRPRGMPDLPSKIPCLYLSQKERERPSLPPSLRTSPPAGRPREPRPHSPGAASSLPTPRPSTPPAPPLQTFFQLHSSPSSPPPARSASLVSSARLSPCPPASASASPAPPPAWSFLFSLPAPRRPAL